MANVKSKEYPIIEIKNLPNKNIVFQNLRDINTKNNVKTSTYYFKLENESTSKENQDVAFVSIDEALDGETIQDPSGAEYVALEVQDSGQIILHDKDVVLWGELCRICANPCDQFVPIFSGEGLENSLSNKIHAYLPLRVSENDDLPHQLCYNCAATLVAYDDIYRGCLDAQKRLNDLHDKLVPKDPIATETAEDENFETILEVDKNKDENEIEEVEDNNLTETQRSCEDEAEADEKESTSIKTFTYMCGVCDALYPEEHNLLCHMKQEHQIESHPGNRIFSYECQVCNKIYSKKSRLINHLKIHDIQQLDEVGAIKQAKILVDQKIKFKCCFCDRILESRLGFMRHYRCHKQVRPVACEKCGKSFRISYDLSRHIRDVHDKIKKYGCEYCDNSFAAKATRDAHQRIHTGERPFPCSRCPKTFRSLSLLGSHTRVHLDVRNYKCDYCRRAFRSKQKLKIHIMSLHTREKPFPCGVCGKNFVDKSEANRHQTVHSSTKQFLCSLCGIGFRLNRYLNAHLKQEHPDQIIEYREPEIDETKSSEVHIEFCYD